MQPKLSTTDYEGFALLPSDQQEKIRRAIAKRLRRKARAERPAPLTTREEKANA